MDEETLPEVAFLVETLEDKVRDKSREAPVRGTRGHRWGRGGTAACPAWGARFQGGRVSPSDLNACRKAAGRCGDAGRQAPGAGGTRHPWRVRQLRFICAHGRVLHGHGKGRRPGGTVRVTPGQRWLCQAPGGLGGVGWGWPPWEILPRALHRRKVPGAGKAHPERCLLRWSSEAARVDAGGLAEKSSHVPVTAPTLDVYKAF